VANAERVRRAQLGVIKAHERIMNRPTAHEDAQLTRQVAKLEAAARTWQELSVDEIVARYAGASTSGSSRTAK